MRSGGRGGDVSPGSCENLARATRDPYRLMPVKTPGHLACTTRPAMEAALQKAQTEEPTGIDHALLERYGAIPVPRYTSYPRRITGSRSSASSRPVRPRDRRSARDVALRPRPVLPEALLLLRLQHARDPERVARRAIPPGAGAGARPRRRPAPLPPRGRPAAPGRRHAHLPRPGPARLARRRHPGLLPLGTRHRGLDRDPPSRHQRPADPDARPARLQPGQHGRPGLRPGRPEAHQPQAVARRDPDPIEESRALGFVSVNVDSHVRAPAPDGRSLPAHARPRRAAPPGPHRPLRLRPRSDDEEAPGALPAAGAPRPGQLARPARVLDPALLAAGYVHIGLDHFALEGDELVRARAAGTLRRNFMGYTTCSDSDVLAFGPSAISEVRGTYIQNARDVHDWATMLEKGRLAAVRGHRPSAEDLARSALIMQLFCSLEVDLDSLRTRFPGTLQDLRDEERDLGGLERDGLVSRKGARIPHHLAWSAPPPHRGRRVRHLPPCRRPVGSTPPPCERRTRRRSCGTTQAAPSTRSAPRQTPLPAGSPDRPAPRRPSLALPPASHRTYEHPLIWRLSPSPSGRSATPPGSASSACWWRHP